MTQLDDRKFENAALAEKLDQKEFSHREEIKKIIATSEEHLQRLVRVDCMVNSLLSTDPWSGHPFISYHFWM